MEIDFLKLATEALDFKNTGERLVERLGAVEQRYEMKECLGEGGMKKIFRAYDHMSGREVAMALLKEEKNEKNIEAFLRESQICSWLQHPGIIPVYDVGLNENGAPYFCMKVMPEGTLSDLLKPERGPALKRRIELFIRICEAINYAHARGVLHLDLKPDNIFVSDFGEVMVSDWGLAMICEESCDSELSLLDLDALDYAEANLMTQHNVLKGTPGYMAPEQLPGSKKPKDTRTDVYALGALLFNILSNKAPFYDCGIKEIIGKVKQGDIPKAVNDSPEALNSVYRKAMAKEPDQRYQSVEDLKKDVQAWLDGYAPLAQEAGLAEQLSLLYNRNRLFLNTLMLAMAILFIVSFFFLRNISQKNSNLQIQQEQLQANFKALKKEELQTADALKQVQKEKLQTIETLEELQKETRIRQQTEKKLVPHYSELAMYEYLHGYDFKKMEHYTTQVLNYAPNHRIALGFRAHLLLLSRDFHTAAEAYKKANLPYHRNLALKYAAPPGELADDEAVFLLINAHLEPGHKLLAEFLLQHILQQEASFETQMQLIKKFFPRLNPMHKTLNFLYGSENGENYLDLSGNAKLMDISLLKYLRVHKLDLSSTGVNDIRNLQKQPLHWLNLSSSRVDSLSGIHLPLLKVLDISSTNINSLYEFKAPNLERINTKHTFLDNSRALKKFPKLQKVQK
ncbi:MAG: serine/threonine protein kinase [Lentisphaeraceae bacterium]|nr:serine/threonine protein kinase [Lentisphaeraceae bacterium]